MLLGFSPMPIWNRETLRALPAPRAATEEVNRVGFQAWHSLFLTYLSEAERNVGSVADALVTAERGLACRYPLLRPGRSGRAAARWRGCNGQTKRKPPSAAP